jgi:integrase
MLEAAPDPLTGSRRRIVRTVRGSKADAERVRAELLIEVGQGRVDARGRSRLNDVIERWLDHAGPHLAPKTLYNYRRSHDRYIRAGLGARPINRIGPVDLDDLYAALRSDGLSAKTIRNVHAMLRRAFGQAIRWGWIRENPASLALPPRVRRPQIVPPSAEDVQRLLRAAETDDEPDLFLFVWLAATTGARRGELGALRWSDFSSERNELLIERSLVGIASELVTKPTKTDRARRIALGRETAQVLVTHRRPIHPDTWTQRFRRLSQRLGIHCPASRSSALRSDASNRRGCTRTNGVGAARACQSSDNAQRLRALCRSIRPRCSSRARRAGCPAATDDKREWAAT